MKVERSIPTAVEGVNSTNSAYVINLLTNNFIQLSARVFIGLLFAAA